MKQWFFCIELLSRPAWDEWIEINGRRSGCAERVHGEDPPVRAAMYGMDGGKERSENHEPEIKF